MKFKSIDPFRFLDSETAHSLPTLLAIPSCRLGYVSEGAVLAAGEGSLSQPDGSLFSPPSSHGQDVTVLLSQLRVRLARFVTVFGSVFCFVLMRCFRASRAISASLNRTNFASRRPPRIPASSRRLRLSACACFLLGRYGAVANDCCRRGQVFQHFYFDCLRRPTSSGTTHPSVSALFRRLRR